LHSKKISLEDALGTIAIENNRPVKELIADMESVYPTGQVELHITDRCDLDCIDCHYQHRSGATIAFDKLPGLVSFLAPRAVTITGGGEPNVYSSHSKKLDDVIQLLRNMLPNTQIGLINNNTWIPPGTWMHHLAWQRTSLDAANAETYRRIKRIDRYAQVIANIEHMLMHTPIAHVGIGFLYRAENVGEIMEFIGGWYDFYRRLPPNVQVRFNIQFRPISPPIQHAGNMESGADYLPSNILTELRKQVQAVAERMRHDDNFASFLETSTNYASFTAASNGDPFMHTKYAFNYCYNALIHRVVRATGEEYPDFLLCEFPLYSLGNTLLGDSIERTKVGLMQYYFHNCGTPFCNPDNCRQSWVSGIFEHPKKTNIEQRPTDNYFF
jgi:molybdenum cofactor biosynthesis enzyme MoaA